MTWGELAQAAGDMRDQSVQQPYLGGLQTRDLAQITSDLIAWQESGYSTDGLALPPVFAAVRLIASTIDQLDLVADFPDDWLQRPRRYGSALDLGDIVQFVVSAMALNGSADLLCRRNGDSWRFDVLHPGSVQPQVSTTGPLTIEWTIGGKKIEPVPAFMDDWIRQLGIARKADQTYRQMSRRDQTQEGEWDRIKTQIRDLQERISRDYLLHIPYFVTPQHPTGCSPINTARQSINGYFAVERQAADLLNKGTYSGGRLETEQDITRATALRWQTQWMEDRAEGKLPLTGAGLRYVNDLISPTDAQWLESRQYNAQTVAQMFGIPTDYLGMAMSGGNSSLSYANSQDNDRRFRRNCLENFTSQIEDALSMLAPQGRGAGEAGTIRFDYSGWEASGADSADADTVDQGQR